MSLNGGCCVENRYLWHISVEHYAAELEPAAHPGDFQFPLTVER